ncbi:hypothetical protein [Chitinimonas sp.]
MAKGQKHSNKESKKPKKVKQVVVPVGTFLAQVKPGDTGKAK